MRQVNKRVFSLLLAGAFAWQAASADMVDNAVGKLGGDYTNVSGSHSYRTATMDGVSGGAASVRVSQRRIQLIAFDPPSLSVGCRGIDAHLGGFSWLSGDQLKAMVKGLAQGVPYVVLQIAISTLDPMLGGLINKATEFLQKVASMSLDSCAASKAIGGLVGGAVIGGGLQGLSSLAGDNAVGNTLGNMGSSAAKSGADNYSSGCAGILSGVSDLGGGIASLFGSTASDYQEASQELCRKPTQWLQTLDDVSTHGNPNDTVQLANLQGNTTWNALSIGGFGAYSGGLWSGSERPDSFFGKSIAPLTQAPPSEEADLKAGVGILILSMTGSAIKPTKNDLKKESFKGSVLSVDSAVHILLCGPKGQWPALKGGTAGDSKATKPPFEDVVNDEMVGICENFFKQTKDPDTGADNTKISVYNCVTTDCEPGDGSDNMKPVIYGENTGSLGPANKALNNSTGLFWQVSKELSDAVKNVSAGKPMTPLQRYLVMSAPFPLWQAINLASVQPDASGKLLAQNVHMLAIMMAGSILGKGMGDLQQGLASTNLPGELVKSIMTIASTLSVQADSDYKNLQALQVTQDRIMKMVDTANKAIMKNAYSTGITGQDFARALSGG